MIWRKASQVARVVQNPATNAGGVRLEFDPWVGKIPLEKGIATHPSILAWKMSHTEPTGAAKARLSN